MADSSNRVFFLHIGELARLIDEFESATLPHEEWRHREHLAVAAWYLIHHDECEATERMIDGLRRYNRANAIHATPGGGYHETLTLFWLALVRDFLAGYPSQPVLTKVNALVRQFGHRPRLHLDFYTRERIMSVEARAGWVPPDRRPLRTELPCLGRHETED